MIFSNNTKVMIRVQGQDFRHQMLEQISSLGIRANPPTAQLAQTEGLMHDTNRTGREEMKEVHMAP